MDILWENWTHRWVSFDLKLTVVYSMHSLLQLILVTKQTINHASKVVDTAHLPSRQNPMHVMGRAF